MNPYLERTAIVAGERMMEELAESVVIVFGLGGVGSWCAEALARTGVGTIYLVDPDTVAPSNVNRQLPALTSTVGEAKAGALARRFRQINPHGNFIPFQKAYTAETASDFEIEKADYVIDAIDSLADKANLILRCTDTSTRPRRAFFSSMGAARKIKPEMISVGEFWNVNGCALARALRTRFRRSGIFPKGKFKCVFSPESISQSGDASANGTFAHITATFGMRLASLVIEDIYRRTH